MVAIYGLIDPETEEIRYIGKTTQSLMSRLEGHCFCKDRRHVSCWVRSLTKKGMKPLIVEIDCVQEEDANVAECLYIEHCLSFSCPLTNLTAGGDDPPSWKGKKHSVQTRLKMSLSHRGKPGTYGNSGRKHSEESKAKISTNNRSSDPRVREKISEALRGRVSPNKGKMMSEEQKLKISTTLKNRKNRQNVSE